MDFDGRLLIAFGLAVLAQGCALGPERIQVNPSFELPASLVGSAKPVAVTAADTRDKKKLGEVGDPNRQMFDVSVEDDPAPAISGSVSRALSRLGYKIEPYDSGDKDRSLTIELQKLKLESDKRAFDFLTTLHAEVLAHARNGNRHFDQKYEITQRMNTAGPAYASDSSKLVNDAVSSALRDMLSDQRLLDALND